MTGTAGCGDVLFALECGCILAGCAQSHAAIMWCQSQQGGFLRALLKIDCPTHHRQVQLVDVVFPESG